MNQTKFLKSLPSVPFAVVIKHYYISKDLQNIVVNESMEA